MINHPLHVIVKFGDEIPIDAHGTAMMAMERRLREVTGLNIEIFKEAKGDEVKSRAAMTPAQRARL